MNVLSIGKIMRHRSDVSSLFFMATNLGSKCLAAVAQLYAVYVFTRVHTRDDAAIIFLLLGYAIWFQIVELGLGQTLQNKFNAKQIAVDDFVRVLIVHFVVMLAVAVLVGMTPLLGDLLLADKKSIINKEALEAFSLGAAILLLASNNGITQRLLLVLDKGQVGNSLVMGHALLAMGGLAYYETAMRPNLSVAVLFYLGPQVLVYVPVLVGLFIKFSGGSRNKEISKPGKIFQESLGFGGLGVLSALYLGLDYYFAAHFLTGEQVVSYHLASRLFFISFVAYYAYVQHRARWLSVLFWETGVHTVWPIFKDAVLVGLGSVSVVYVVAVLLQKVGMLAAMSHGVGVGQSLLCAAFTYFLVRVCRDVGLVIAGGLSARRILYGVYLVELVVGFSLLTFLVPKFGGVGIFVSMALASTVGLILLSCVAKQRGIFREQR